MTPNNSSLGSRVFLPALLTTLGLAVGATFAIFFSWPQVVLYLAILPLPVALLWMASSVQSPEARIATLDAAHARRAVVQ